MMRGTELPRGMPLVTRMFASSEHAWDPMVSSSVKFCRIKSTAQQPETDDANPNAAESMVKIAHRTLGR
jgi:hypothetical protein